MRCAARVHEAIKIGKANIWDAGTTTLLAGVLCQTETHAALNNCQWCFNCISIGDCRAYHWSRQTTRIREITEGNRTNLTDSKDPGGRLGPYIYQVRNYYSLHNYIRGLISGFFAFSGSTRSSQHETVLYWLQ